MAHRSDSILGSYVDPFRDDPSKDWKSEATLQRQLHSSQTTNYQGNLIFFGLTATIIEQLHS